MKLSETQTASARLGEDLSMLKEGEVISAGHFDVEVLEITTEVAKQTINTDPKPVVRKPPLITRKPPLLGNFVSPFIRPKQNYKPITAAKFDRSMLAPFFSVLREHQIEAVEFMYNCVLNFFHDLGSGCILADEMGLGKTLSTIACVYTLLKQQHIANAVVVCPATLILNWRDEFRKWIPSSQQLGVLAFDSAHGENCLDMFFGPTKSKVYQILIISYERLRSFEPKEDRVFDLVVCDEAHRLKSKKSLTNEALNSFSSEKRILLTGTPIQNDMLEFYTLASFANANCLGAERRFLQAVDDEDDDGLELQAVCDKFMLRRTSAVLSKYVSVAKSEHLVFIRMHPDQEMLYRQQTASKLANLEFKPASEFLQWITELRKTAFGYAGQSGKLAFLAKFLAELKKSTSEKIVLVSGSTRVLDLCQQLCAAQRYTWMRLDGSTPQSKRMTSVKLFNSLNSDQAFVFLLSARSGGAGINLIGASRLVLLDGDWNPAVDLQAIARIYRDGQKRECHVYRLFSANTIDEKIFQRQIHKTDISTSVLELETSPQEFSVDQLRDLFTFTNFLKCSTLETRQGETDLRGFEEVQLKDAEPVLKSVDGVICILTHKT